MRWRGRQGSHNIEDRRGRGGGKVMGGGIFGLIIGGILWLVFGVNPITAFQTGSSIGNATSGVNSSSGTALTDKSRDPQFVSVVLKDTENVWNQIFAQRGMRYREPTLVLFDGRVRSACGSASAATGPFYCPGDQKLYLDMSFFRDMRRRMGITGDINGRDKENLSKAGDFAQAYVIAHEVGHHVQTLLGISSQVQQARQRMSRKQGNQLSVRQELQADCFAGVWANHNQKATQFLHQGDIEEALHAASHIGDDHIQRTQTGVVRPESFTHGSSAQRVEWFKRGLTSGNIEMCDTFSGRI